MHSFQNLDPARHARIRHRTPTSTITTRPPWSTLKWTPYVGVDQGGLVEKTRQLRGAAPQRGHSLRPPDQAELTAAVVRPSVLGASAVRAGGPTPPAADEPRELDELLNARRPAPGTIPLRPGRRLGQGDRPPDVLPCWRVKTVCELPREKLARLADSRTQRPPLCGGRPLGGGRIAAVPAPS